MKEKILISGCTGLTSKYATLKILNKYKNIEVIGFSRNIKNSFSSSSFTFLKGDANNMLFWRDLLKNFRPNTILINSNIRHFIPFLDAINSLDIKEYPRVVIVCTTGIFSKFNSFNFLYKQIEDVIKSYKGDFLILRPRPDFLSGVVTTEIILFDELFNIFNDGIAKSGVPKNTIFILSN